MFQAKKAKNCERQGFGHTQPNLTTNSEGKVFEQAKMQQSNASAD